MCLHLCCSDDVSDMGAIIRETAPPIAVAPEELARPVIGFRSLAAVALVACLSVLAALSGYAWRHRVDVSGFASHPKNLDPAVWRSVLTTAATPERKCPSSAPVVVLYVSRSCPHCLAELQRWSGLFRSNSPAIRCIGLAIVAAPVRASVSADWMPPGLSSMLLWDHDGTVAHALDIRLVPVAAYVTNRGAVVSRVVGEASDSVTNQHLVDLRIKSTGEGGAR